MVSKTPEELAEEYTKDWWGNLPEAEGMRKSARENFLAGYQAAKDHAVDVNKMMPQWISVKDRLPDSTPIVLAMCIDGYELAYYGNYGKGQWTNTLGTEHLNITHWMPLPAAPKEEA